MFTHGNETHKPFVLVGMGHLAKHRMWTLNFVCVSHIVLAMDTTLVFDADDVFARRLPFTSIDGCVSLFVDTDHFTLALDHAWDINRRI